MSKAKRAVPEGFHTITPQLTLDNAAQAIDWNLHGMGFYRALAASLRPYLWPFVVGNTVLGVLAGLIGYVVLRFVLERKHAPETGSPA